MLAGISADYCLRLEHDAVGVAKQAMIRRSPGKMSAAFFPITNMLTA